jgi:hypothetical protein
MTQLGKILVFVNLLLSVGMLGVAFAVSTNRIDWSAAAPKGDKPAGLLVARQEHVKTASAELAVAGERWRESLAGSPGRAGLPAWEKQIADDRVWYAGLVEEAKTGPKNKPQNTAIQVVQFGADGLPIPDAKNNDRPTLVPGVRRRATPDEAGKPLFWRDRYVNEMTHLTQQISAAQTEYQQLVKEAAELTQLASGPKPTQDKEIRDVVAPKYDLKPGDIPLRQRIIDEETKSARVKEEMQDVTGREKNADVALESLVSRQERLERRVEELKKK